MNTEPFLLRDSLSLGHGTQTSRRAGLFLCHHTTAPPPTESQGWVKNWCSSVPLQSQIFWLLGSCLSTLGLTNLHDRAVSLSLPVWSFLRTDRPQTLGHLAIHPAGHALNRVSVGPWIRSSTDQQGVSPTMLHFPSLGSSERQTLKLLCGEPCKLVSASFLS